MPSADITALVFQGGMVGVFVVFVILWTDRMAKSKSDRDQAMREFFAFQRISDREVLQKLVDSVDKLGAALAAHDGKTDTAIATMQERTKNNTPTRPRKSRPAEG